MKKHFHKILIHFLSFAFISTVFLTSVSAQNYGLNEAAGKANYDTQNQDVYGYTNTVVNALLAILGIVFFGYFLYAGVRWLTSRGNEEFIAKAKSSMGSAITGLIIIMIAYGITTLVFNRLNANR